MSPFLLGVYMLLTLYKTLDGDNVINKTLTEPESITIYLKSDTDITNPDLILETIAGVDYKDYNYCFITEIERFYFVRNITVMNNTVSKLSCEVDYLETYKTEILTSEAYYRSKINVGDYGEYESERTGREIITNEISPVVLEETDNSILSVYRWG